jgi:hypothetical protein
LGKIASQKQLKRLNAHLKVTENGVIQIVGILSQIQKKEQLSQFQEKVMFSRFQLDGTWNLTFLNHPSLILLKSMVAFTLEIMRMLKSLN